MQSDGPNSQPSKTAGMTEAEALVYHRGLEDGIELSVEVRQATQRLQGRLWWRRLAAALLCAGFVALMATRPARK